MLLIFSRALSHVPLKILSIEDGTVLKDFSHLLHRNKKVDFIEQFNEKLLVKQENENLQILDVCSVFHFFTIIILFWALTRRGNDYPFIYERVGWFFLISNGSRGWLDRTSLIVYIWEFRCICDTFVIMLML